jgi:preprotein translocase subunit YajC
MMDFFIQNAYAASDAQASQSVLSSFIPLVLIMVVFYFLLIRPQQKRLKEHQDMIKVLAKGSKILTAGGIIGTVVKVEDEILIVEVAENTRVKIKKDTVLDIINETKA